jgi:hypothetical protein
MGLLTGAAKGLGESLSDIGEGIISEQMQMRREKRLAEARGAERAEERGYKEGVRAEERELEEERYGRRQTEEQKKYERRQGEEEKKYQRRLAEEEASREYVDPEGRIYRGGKPVMVTPPAERVPEGLLSSAATDVLRDEMEARREPVQALKGISGAKAAPAAIQTAEWIAQAFNVTPKEAWDISMRGKNDPREMALELFRKRRKDVDDQAMDETEEQSWAFVERALQRVGFGSERKPAQAGANYATKEEVRDAFRRGEIDEAKAIDLVNQMMTSAGIK